MAQTFLTSINLSKNELQNARLQNLGTAPSGPVSGQFYFDTGGNRPLMWDSSAWVPMAKITVSELVDTTTVGTNLATLTNPSAITFLRVNADNTVTALNAASFLTAIGAQASLGYTPVDAAGDTMTGQLVLPASTVSEASLNLPHGTAPTTPVNGDVWTTTTGLNVRINGTTYELGTGAGTVTSVAVADATGLTWSGSPITTSGTLTPTLSVNLQAWHALATSAKQDTITGAATTITASDLTASRALVSDGSGKVAVSTVTTTELGHVSGVTSPLQTQLDAKAPIASPTFTGVPAAPTAAEGTSTTQIATTAYVVSEILARLASNDAMQYQGAIDASTNPNYPAADSGDTYRISVAGKIGGASGPNVEVGDMLICHVDSSAGGTHATVGADWDIIQTNIDGALTTSDIGVTVQAYDANATSKYAVDVGDGVSTAIVVTHSLGTRDVTVSVHRSTTPWDEVYCDVEKTSTTTVTLRFAVAPTSAEFRCTVIG